MLDAGAAQLGVPATAPGSDPGTSQGTDPGAGQPAVPSSPGAPVSAARPGDLRITEFVAIPPSGGAEWIEIFNATASPIDLSTVAIVVDSHPELGALAILAPGNAGPAPPAAIVLAPGSAAYGVPNPAAGGPVPAGAAFVFGAPGALGGDALADGGDALALVQGATVIDRVDFHRVVVDPAATPGPADFPLVPGTSTQLDPGALVSRTGTGAAGWCAPLFAGPTPGQANRDCGALVISEVLLGAETIAGPGDPRQQFVEIAGPAGASLAGVVVTAADWKGAVAGEVSLPAGRMPMRGLWVVAEGGASGATLVAGASQVGHLGLVAARGAVQLLRAGAAPPVLLDALAYGAVSPGQKDARRGLPLASGAPVADLAAAAHPLDWCRSDDEATSGDAARDFRYTPAPTPGARNGRRGLAITAMEPADALATATATVVLRGTELSDGMTVAFGGVPVLGCRFVEAEALACVVPPLPPAATATRVAVTVRPVPEYGPPLVLPDAFTRTLPLDGTGSAAEAGYCNLQWPARMTLAARAVSAPIYGRIFQRGVTDGAGPNAGPGVVAELGYGPVGSDPTRSNAWIWAPATFNVKAGLMRHDDEYQGTLTVPASGAYAYTFRFSRDGGLTFTYADLDGAGANSGLAFSPGLLGTLTVQ